jgi:hypothetical protein
LVNVFFLFCDNRQTYFLVLLVFVEKVSPSWSEKIKHRILGSESGSLVGWRQDENRSVIQMEL